MQNEKTVSIHIHGAKIDAYYVVSKVLPDCMTQENDCKFVCKQKKNSTVVYQHAMIIGGIVYTFLSYDKRHFVYSTDIVDFTYYVARGRYNNVVASSIRTYTKNGATVDRGRKAALYRKNTQSQQIAGTRKEVSEKIPHGYEYESNIWACIDNAHHR